MIGPLAISKLAGDNSSMNFTGHIENGAVVLDGNPVLPEGASVTVAIEVEPVRTTGKRILVPLVRTGAPGTVHLTNERIAEIFEEEEEDIECASQWMKK